MNLVYGEDKFFIGIVKFFDSKKDFGFIASNNCNMDTPCYHQDFYVSSSSFKEEIAQKEGKVVVFQIEKQENHKERAVNVRCITKSDEDVQLALSYYGDHEYILFNDDRKINLYTSTYKPLSLVADKVKHIIENDPERSPEKTAEHFQFFVGHYKVDAHSNDRYVFDKQFSTDGKAVWDSLLSIFTENERLAVLNIYPTIVRYFSSTRLIQKWLEQKLNDDSNLSDWQDVYNTFEYIPQNNVDFAKQRIEEFVDGKIKEVFDELATLTDLSERDFKPSHKTLENHILLNRYSDVNKRNAISKLWQYLRLTSKKYEREKAMCIASQKKNHFNKELAEFVEKPFNYYGRDQFFTYLDRMPSEDLQAFRKVLEIAISRIFDSCINEKNYSQIVSDIKKLSVMGEGFLSPYKLKLFPFITESLKELLHNYLNSSDEFNSHFFTQYDHFTSIYGNSEKEEIKQKLIPIIRETTSIWVLSSFSSGTHKWIKLDEALALSEQIVSEWNYENIRTFVKNGRGLFDNNILFVDLIIARFNALVGKTPLTLFFDGTPLEDRGYLYDMSTPEEENCLVLKNLKDLIPNGQRSSEWNNYIKTRSVDDLLILFKKGVVDSMPENIVESIVNSISLDELSINKDNLHKPSLKNQLFANIFRSTEVNLFPIIAHRLQSLEMTDENVILAVLLTELMTANMPSEDCDYYTRKNWESNFSNQIQNYKASNSIDQRLSVIWWAVYSKTTASSASLKEVFSVLPPYLQIKTVKVLFKSISEGKLQFTAESLYNLVADGGKPIYFPLEIAFTYLKLREKDPSKTLDNNVMLQLLEGRDNPDEWVGIRSLVTQCSGRWSAIELSNNRSNPKCNSYYNGIITKLKDGRLKVFIPFKMVDKFGKVTSYNNKHYERAEQLIQITYNKNEYQVVNETNGVAYYFNESHEVDLFTIARTFDFKYNGLNHLLGFEKSKDDQELFCECRQANVIDNYHRVAFYWCGNKPCFRPYVRYHTNDEWEDYTILDFMRILGISPDYITRNEKCIKFGHYIILSTYLKSFAKFYEHLKCRGCGNLMKPFNISNFASRAITEFSCTNENCLEKGKVVYLNHCFNSRKCNATIDSRDSKKCPNGQYICPECGACCSTENFRFRISNLQMTGGYISDRLRSFVMHDLGHWEKHEFFCYKCGQLMDKQNDGTYVCSNCHTKYVHKD